MEDMIFGVMLNMISNWVEWRSRTDKVDPR